ncbi:MAG: thioredoxin family protein [Lachnospiraceae bacterium]|jgi:thioredoxin 1|nr:thioredoxin family protein [Lachnospiraceae bacterium]
MIREIDKSTFDREVGERGAISIVDFFTPDCPTCCALGKVFEQVAAEQTDIKFFKVDLEEDITLAERFSIDHIPTLIIFRDGEPIKTNVGYLEAPELTEFLYHRKVLL